MKISESVWKYTLIAQESNLIGIPIDNKILSVKSQFGDIVVYALVDPYEKKKEQFDFRVYGTGQEIVDINTDDYKFLDTVQLENGNLMFHVFYKKVD